MAPADGNGALAIIGGTGKTGKWAIKAALQRGKKVRVLCRTPDKLKAIYEALWSPVCPDDLAYDEVATARDEQLAALRELVAGASHVISFLGMDPKNKQPVCRPAIESLMIIVSYIMSSSKPKILIMSSIIVSDSYAQGKAAWGCCGCVGGCMRWKLLRMVFDDLEAAEAYVLENREAMGLDVTVLRATVLGDKNNYSKDYSNDNASYYMVKSSELKKVKMNVDRQHVVECFMDAVADKEGRYSSTEWSIFDA